MPSVNRLFLLLFFALAGSAYASCGTVSCPLDLRSALIPEKGLVRVGYEFEFIDQDQPRIGTHRARVGDISGHHDEQRTLNRQHRLVAMAGVTDRLSLELALPYISRSHRHVHNHNGGAEIIPQGWNLDGIGDLSVQARYALIRPPSRERPTVYALAGVEFPTGDSHVRNAGGDEAEPGITPGSGSYDFLTGLGAVHHATIRMPNGDIASMPLFLTAHYRINGRGVDRYRIGNQLSVNLGMVYPVIYRLSVLSQLNWIVRNKDDAGDTAEEVEKTGGETLYVSPGLQVHLTESLEWTGVIQIPVRQRVNEIQLTSDYNLLTSLNYKFRLF